jgi:hypothetical protein
VVADALLVALAVDVPAGGAALLPEVLVADVEVATPGGAVAEIDADGPLAPGGGDAERGDGVRLAVPLGEELGAQRVPVAFEEGPA